MPGEPQKQKKPRLEIAYSCGFGQQTVAVHQDWSGGGSVTVFASLCWITDIHVVLNKLLLFVGVKDSSWNYTCVHSAHLCLLMSATTSNPVNWLAVTGWPLIRILVWSRKSMVKLCHSTAGATSVPVSYTRNPTEMYRLFWTVWMWLFPPPPVGMW